MSASASTGAILRHQSNLYGGIQAIGSDGTLYSASYHTVEATDPYGVAKWTATVSSSIFIDNLVVDASGQVFCTSEENQLLAFSPTGRELWSLTLPASDWQSLPPVIGPNGKIYVEDGNMLMAITGTVPEPSSTLILTLSIIPLMTRRRTNRVCG